MIHHFAAKLMAEHDVTFRIHGPTIARPAGAIDELQGMLSRVWSLPQMPQQSDLTST